MKAVEVPHDAFVVRLETHEARMCDRLLARAIDAVMTGRAKAIVFEIGRRAMSGCIATAMQDWMDRYAMVIRENVDMMIFVAPSTLAWLALKLDFVGKRPPAPYVVVRRKP